MSRILVTGIFVLCALSTLVVAIHSSTDAIGQPTTTLLAIAAHDILKVGVIAAFSVFVAIRQDPARHSRRPLAFGACAAAIIAIVLIGAPETSDGPARIVVGDSMTALWAAWTLISVLALGRCFGVLPEARGLVQRGPYRIVRHPVYLGEFGMCAGFLIAAPTALNLACGAAFAAAQAIRMRLEEDALLDEFPEYAEYAATTPRLIPYRRGATAGSVRTPAVTAPAKSTTL
jgi:protein-S-isoprenylcysteine O-methyltransferase Ste14